MYFWLTLASIDFESGKSINNNLITHLFLCFFRREHLARQLFPILQVPLSYIRQ